MSNMLIAPIGTLTGKELDERWFDGEPGPWVLVKTHMFLPYFSDRLRIIGIVRDPRDVAVCRWMRRRHDRPYTLLDWIRRFGTRHGLGGDESDGASYIDFVEALFASGRPLVRYGDLHRDGPRTLARAVSETTGLPFAPEHAKLSFSAITFERCKEADPHWTRKGIVGDWRNHFGSEEARLANELWGEHLLNRGFETDPHWWEKTPFAS
jgi:hypothetical protein